MGRAEAETRGPDRRWVLEKPVGENRDNLQRLKPFLTDLGIGTLIFFGYYFRPVFLSQGTLARGFDGSVQSYPWLEKLVQGWHSFSVPLWDFSSFGGTTFIGELQPGVLYPGHLVFSLLTGQVTQSTFNAYIAAHYVLAFAFMNLFLRGSGLGFLPRLLGSFAFAAYLDWSQPNRFFGMVFLPLLLVCVTRSIRSRSSLLRDPNLYGGGFVLAIMLLAGHQQPWAHGVVAMALYTVVCCWRKEKEVLSRTAIRLIGMVLVSALVAAPQWLLSLEYIRRAYRWAPDRILGLQRVSYQAFGHTDILSRDYLDYMSRSWMPLVTAAVLLLILLGKVQRKRLAILGLTLGLFAFLASLGDAGFISRLTWHIPLFTIVRGAERYIFLIFFAAAVLLALLSEWLLSRRKRPFWLWVGRGAFLALAIWVLHHSQGLLRPQPDSLALSPARQFARTRIVQELVSRHQAEPFYRVFNYQQCIARNAGNAHGLLTVRGHRATIYAPYYDFVSAALADPMSPKHALLGVRYVVSPQPLSLPLILQEGSLFLYERPRAAPIFYSAKAGSSLTPAPIQSVHWSENSVTLELAGDFAETLTFAQPHYPGWVVYVDGQQRELLEPGLFQGVHLRAGDRRVTFSYRPPLLYFGLVLALIPVCGVALARRSRVEKTVS